MKEPLKGKPDSNCKRMEEKCVYVCVYIHTHSKGISKGIQSIYIYRKEMEEKSVYVYIYIVSNILIYIYVKITRSRVNNKE